MNETRSPEAHNPGGKIKLKLPHFIRGTATFSPCGKYRHLLTRDWQAPLWQDRRYVLWIGMNPSTGDADHDDPTIRREIYFTMRLGYPRLIMANIMDYRATNPKTLLASGNPRSPQNIPHIIEAAKAATLIVAAWGSLPAALAGYTKAVEDALHAIYPAPPIACLGFTKDGAPRHPLYVRATAPLIAFPCGAPSGTSSAAAAEDRTKEAPEFKRANKTCAPCAAAGARAGLPER